MTLYLASVGARRYAFTALPDALHVLAIVAILRPDARRTLRRVTLPEIL